MDIQGWHPRTQVRNPSMLGAGHFNIFVLSSKVILLCTAALPMKAHIVTEKEVATLLEKLELLNMRQRVMLRDGDGSTMKQVEIFEAIHRIFHYEVVSFFS